jgi:chaperone required for assembly of F1-ATPase
MKRSYKDAVVTSENGVALDGKPLKTPRGASLILPTRALAEAVAAEWDAQGDKIDPQSMPLAKLANTAIDGVAPRREDAIEELVKFAGHDLLCYRAERPAELVARQAKAWDPLLDWAAERYGARLVASSGIASIQQPEGAIGALHRALGAFDPFALAALGVAASICGSLVLALAIAQRRLSAPQAFSLSQIDETYQAETWGVDSEAEARVWRLENELKTAARFLELSANMGRKAG